MIEPHRHDSVYIARGKEDALVTLNLVPGSDVYGEKRISVDVSLPRLLFGLILKRFYSRTKEIKLNTGFGILSEAN